MTRGFAVFTLAAWCIATSFAVHEYVKHHTGVTMFRIGLGVFLIILTSLILSKTIQKP